MIYSTQTLWLDRKFGIERAVDMIIDAGFKHIDLTFDHQSFDIGDTVTRDRIKAKAAARGADFIQAHAPFGGGYENYTKNLIPTLPKVFEYCSVLGIPNVVVHPIQNGKYYGNEERLFDMNMEFYTSLVPLARDNGVRIAIENMWQKHYVNGNICDDVCAPPEELARYYDTLNDPEHFTVCLDLGHVSLCGREPEDAIRTIGGERLGCIHAHDTDYRADLHTLPGCGRMRWDNICRALAEVNYTGSFNLEADEFYRGFHPDYYPTAARFMHDTARFLAEKIEAYKSEK